MRYAILMTLLLLTGCGTEDRSQHEARSLLEQGIEQYRQQAFTQAAETFQAVSELEDTSWASLAQYNRGNALFRQTNHTAAVAAYQEAGRTPDISLHADACYNQANAARLLINTATNLTAEQAIRQLHEVLELYRKALLLNAELHDARINYELTLQQVMSVRGFLSHVSQVMIKSQRLVEGRKYSVAADLLKTSQEDYAPLYQSFPEQQKQTGEYLKRVQDIIGILESETSALEEGDSA